MGVLGTGVSGLLSLQRALAVTSQNISNVNTEGYSRQEVNFSARKPQADSGGFIGSGVFVDSVERVYDDFITQQIRTNSAGFNQAQQFNRLAAQVDSLLADPQAGLMPALQGFFNAVQGVADDPSSMAARQVMISEARTMESRFEYLDQRLGSLSDSVNISVRNAVTEINGLTSAIAAVNRDIGLARTTGNGEPNDLLDQRDLLITRLSEYVSVTTVQQDDGDINVFIGNGQVVVAGTESRQLAAVPNSFDPSRTEVGYISSNNNVVLISEQMSGGILGGTIEFRNQVLDSARNALGRIAIGLTSTFNVQHASGIDMNGQQGGNFFSPIDTSTTMPTAQVYANSRNTGLPPGQIGVILSDAGQLTTSDYRLERNGNTYTLTRLSDSVTTVLANFPSGSEEVDGMTLSLDSGTMADGDSFLIRPVQNGARNFSVAMADPKGIAAAGLVRAEPVLANTSDASISTVEITDPSSYNPEEYTLYSAKSTPAAVNGSSDGAINDTGTDNALAYQLAINGVVVYTQGEGAPVLSNLDALAGVINDDIASTGVRAYVDDSNNTLYFANEPPTAQPVTVTERLVDTNGTPLALDAADSVTGYFGSALSGSNPNNDIAFTGQADSYYVVNGSGITVTSGAYSSGGKITIDALEVSVSGAPSSGDAFSLVPNINGVGDNRNALALAGMQVEKLLDNGRATFEGAYSSFVVDVGTKTRQSEVNRDAQEGLLNQAVAAREEKSGVNLDEEAANLLRFQQAYTAAAQIISTADNMFQTLMNVVRR